MAGGAQALPVGLRRAVAGEEVAMDETTADSREGTDFGPYRLRRLVGRGGMGDVYEAEDTVRERIVALKLMSQTLSNDPVFRSRMQREARTAGRLQEPHVVPIHDFGEIEGQLYIGKPDGPWVTFIVGHHPVSVGLPPPTEKIPAIAPSSGLLPV